MKMQKLQHLAKSNHKQYVFDHTELLGYNLQLELNLWSTK